MKNFSLIIVFTEGQMQVSLKTMHAHVIDMSSFTSLMLNDSFLNGIVGTDGSSAKVCSVGTNPKSLNFEHSNFGLFELLTSQTYPKKCRPKSYFRV